MGVVETLEYIHQYYIAAVWPWECHLQRLKHYWHEFETYKTKGLPKRLTCHDVPPKETFSGKKSISSSTYLNINGTPRISSGERKANRAKERAKGSTVRRPVTKDLLGNSGNSATPSFQGKQHISQKPPVFLILVGPLGRSNGLLLSPLEVFHFVNARHDLTSSGLLKWLAWSNQYLCYPLYLIC